MLRGKVLDDLGFLRGEVRGELGFSMKTEESKNHEIAKETKEENKKPEEHEEGNQKTEKNTNPFLRF